MEEPLHLALKHFFKQNPKMGSRDRRSVSQLVYAYFRGFVRCGEDVDAQLSRGLFWATEGLEEVVTLLDPYKLSAYQQPFEKRVELVPFEGAYQQWEGMLSVGVSVSELNKHFLQIPDVFIRMRPQAKVSLSKRFKEQVVAETDALRFAPATKLEEIDLRPHDYVVQDLSSQKTGTYFHPKPQQQWWDACAASGGKSILLYDLCPSIKLTVSDIRSSILQNLHARFKQAGIQQYQYFTADLTQLDTLQKRPSNLFDGILLDVPCSGSGTWARTPEQLQVFSNDKLIQFTLLQTKIVDQVLPSLKVGGRLIYMTCSVFKEENEKQVERICAQHGLQLDRMELINGCGLHADSMFVAVLKKG
jgi:16S rRNA (cytosine967-C5)-methyltransferase